MDEWWDRCDYGFKLKIQAFVFFALLGVVVAWVLWAHQKSERQAWLEAGWKLDRRELRQKVFRGERV